ncbi:thioredoxin family protein [Flavobacterium frigoris]|uniref:Thioredoxin Disulfide Isomerase n=1 Tax=Flavobacterium frigoris (strain PS1) TaxID=1086011 RepID=H7FV18_FLAFP|nr:thioredoxin family protein [Flavobacterium frigoris]EIA07580.1 thioredoxin Disulfide Isomerase [Flavobacterium frigoris PS1]
MKNKMAFLLLFMATMGYSQNWNTDFTHATTAAIEQNKPIILVFSGSDWCAPCIKLDKSIWQSEAFKSYAATNYILERADFPKKKQNQLAEEIKKQNESLAEKYNKEGIFPLVVVIDGKGKVLGKTSYKNVTPNEYIETLNSFLK